MKDNPQTHFPWHEICQHPHRRKFVVDGKELLKALIIFAVFPIGAPLLGILLKNRPRLQDLVFGLMCFMTINGFLGAGNWGLTLDSHEFYRGHARGYHFYFNHAAGIALFIAAMLERPLTLPRRPPGLLLYLLYCAVSSISIVNAVRPDFHWMAMHKMLFVLCIFLGAYGYLRTPGRILFFFRVMAVVLCWQALVVLKTRYLDGQYQARGTFEHQNALAMYANLISMTLLALALGPDHPRNKWLFAGFLASCLIIVAALSRASMAIFGVGVVCILMVSLLQRPSAQRLILIGGFVAAAFLGGLLSIDTIVSRFHDDGNTASAEYRAVLNQAALAMLRDNPLGVGWNNFAEVINEPYPYSEFVWQWLRDRNHTVNTDRVNSCVESHYFLILAENGWLGLVAFLCLILWTLFRNVRAALTLHDTTLRLVSLGIAMGCLLNYAQSHLERVLTQPRNLMLWMILLAVTARIEQIRRDQRSVKDNRPSRRRHTHPEEMPAEDPLIV